MPRGFSSPRRYTVDVCRFCVWGQLHTSHYGTFCRVGDTWEKSHPLSERLAYVGIVGAQFRTPFNSQIPQYTIVLCDVRWVSGGVLNCSPMMPRDASLSEVWSLWFFFSVPLPHFIRLFHCHFTANFSLSFYGQFFLYSTFSLPIVFSANTFAPNFSQNQGTHHLPPLKPLEGFPPIRFWEEFMGWLTESTVKP